MATPKQIAANRRNAQKSCGPKSAETKAKVSRNPVQHGLCAKFRVLEEVEQQEDFDAFLRQLIEDEQPVGQAEIELVVKMAEHTWLAKRALRLQNLCFSLEPKTPEQIKSGEIPVAVDYHLERYQRASADLQKRKKARQLAEIGFASQERKRIEEARLETRDLQRAEKHAVQIEIAHVRKQREELNLANALAKLLPADRAHSASDARCARLDFDPSSLNASRSAGAPQPTPPAFKGD